MSIRAFLVRKLIPLIKWLGKAHAPLSQRKITEKHVNTLRQYLKAGDIILTYNSAQLTNLFIKGKWKHAAMYCPKEGKIECIIEAVSPRVRAIGIYDFLMSKDKIAIVRFKDMDELARARAASLARMQQYKEYDFMFKLDSENRFYCSELIWYCLKNSVGIFNFELRKSLGEYTVTPTDFYLAKKYFEVIAEC